LEKKGRLIDGVRLYAVVDNPENPAEPIVTLKNPKKIILDQDSAKTDRAITIVSEDGTKTKVIMGKHEEHLSENIVSRVAYKIYEQRGYQHGQDMDDWLVAERKIKETELEFVR